MLLYYISSNSSSVVLDLLSFPLCIEPLFGLNKPVRPTVAVDFVDEHVEVDTEVEVIPSDCLSPDGMQILRTSAAKGMHIRTSIHTILH